MEKDLKKIKKLYGEKMSRFCREAFPAILEEEGSLVELLTSHFEPNHDLCNDIHNNSLQAKFKNYIYSLIEYEEEKETNNKTPSELMSKAGYDLYECKTEEEVQSFKKYYIPSEELCTFHGGRLNSCKVFFAVKKNILDIKREDFKNPQRQDEYGTSVISIQFTKDGTNTLSIKNRYNHTVANPDATFSNDLDNIIPGLTKSFEKHYGIVQRYKNNCGFEIPGYVRANDGKFYKTNYEMFNVCYCPNNIIIDNFEVKRYEKEKYVILDYFILDLIKKEIKIYDKGYVTDAFVDTIKKIDKISIKKSNDEKEIKIINKKGNEIIIKLNNLNKIIFYENYSLKKVGNKFLYNNDAINTIILPNVTKIGSKFCNINKELRNLNLDSVKKIGDSFCRNNTELLELKLGNLEKMGNNCFMARNSLKKVDMPNVKIIGDDFLTNNIVLEEMNMPNLIEVGHGFCTLVRGLPKANLEKLKTIGESFLSRSYLNYISMPKLKYIRPYESVWLSNCNSVVINGKVLIVKKGKRYIGD